MIGRWTLVFLLLSLGGGLALAQESITLEEIAGLLKLTDGEKEALRNGEFVRRDAEETTKKELAAALLVVLDAPFADVVKHAQNLEALKVDQDVLAYHEIGDRDPTPDDFADAVFGADETDEIRKLAEAKSGSAFNLSEPEFAALEALRASHSGRCDKDPACAAAFNASYSKILLDRAIAYRKGGLASVAAYDRGKDDPADPAGELRGALNAMPFLKAQMPTLFKAFLEYPSAPVDGATHTLLWKKQKVQDRPTFSLAHRMVHNSPAGLIMLEREFFVGQSYNSLQVAAGAFPVEGRTLVVYLNRTSTDQVAGFASGTRHSIGRKMMVGEIKKNFEDIKARLASAG